MDANAHERRAPHRRLRRAVQVLVVAALVAIPLSNLVAASPVQGTLCSAGTEHWHITCALGALQTSLASRQLLWPLLLSALPFVVLAVALGRVFCGWICPQHMASEAGDAVRTKLGRNADPKPDTKQRARRGKVVVLCVLALVLLGSFAAGAPIFCYVCPVGIICRNIASVTYLGVLGGEVAVVGLILLAEVTIARRGWCKYLCPIGALYGLCTTRWSLRPTRTAGACVGCRSCERDCALGNSPMQQRVGITCTNCGSCLDVCPEGALHFGLGADKKPPRPLPVVSGEDS